MRPVWLCLIALLCLMTQCLAGEPVLLDFTADWCGPCRQTKAAVGQLQAEGYQIRQIDADQNPAVLSQYAINGLPTFVVTNGDGKELDRHRGSASHSTLKGMLDRHRQPSVQVQVGVGGPHPAWRYEAATAHRAAVVRILTKDRDGTRSGGSGVPVRWAGRVVALTARHVVQDAVTITIRTATGKCFPARALFMDAAWDCAVLEVPQPLDIEPAALAFGQGAELQIGQRYESCGWGPCKAPERLAANTGELREFTSNQPNGAGEWAATVGYARPGDSGGPVFNTQGQVVGIIWGCEPKYREVQWVQIGRVHALLQRAIPLGRTVMQQQFPSRSGHQVYPTPNPGTQPLQCDPSSGCCPTSKPLAPVVWPDASSAGGKDYMLPYRQEEAAKQTAMNQQLQTISGQLQAIQQAMAASGQQQPSAPQVIVQQPAAPEVERPGNKLEQKLDAFLEKLPIKGPLGNLADRQLESEHPLQRFFGASLAIVLITVVGGGLVLGTLLLGHKVYQAAHAHKAQIDTKLAGVPVLQKAFDRVDDFNTAKIEPHIQAAIDKVRGAAVMGLGAATANPTVMAAPLVAEALSQIKDHITALMTPPAGGQQPPVNVNVTAAKS